MPEERRSRTIYRKEIDIDGRTYALDLYDGEIPPLSEGDREIIRDSAGIYRLIFVRKEQDDKKCDRDHHYCHKHGRCERDDHDCDDKRPCPPCPDPGDGHDNELDRRILSEVQDIKSELSHGVDGGHDSEIDRKILEEVNDQAQILRRIISDVESDRDRDIDRRTLNAVISLTNVCNNILSILQSTPPPTPLPPIPPPSPSPSPSPPPPSPTPSPPPPPPASKTRVIIQGEVDVPTEELNEEDKPQDPKQQDQISAATVADIKSKYPKLKITKVLVARGTGPVGPVW